MNPLKRSKYTLRGSEHTFAIKATGIVEAKTQAAKESTGITIHNVDEIESTIVVNPNKYCGDIFRFSDFKEVVKRIVADCGIESYRFVRTDFRLDSYDPEHYKAFKKLNRYLLAALTVTYKIKNSYITYDMMTLKQKTQAIKGERFEAENYDRAAKSRQTENHREPAQSRFELRTMAKEWKRTYVKAEAETENMELFKADLVETWFMRLDAALNHLEEVQALYNNTLEGTYRELKEEDRMRTITDFILWYQDFIFTKKQLIDLYKRLDDTGADPVEKASNHKKRYGIEFFSKADAKYAVAEIKRAILEFLEK